MTSKVTNIDKEVRSEILYIYTINFREVNDLCSIPNKYSNKFLVCLLVAYIIPCK